MEVNVKQPQIVAGSRDGSGFHIYPCASRSLQCPLCRRTGIRVTSSTVKPVRGITGSFAVCPGTYERKSIIII